MLLDTNSFCDSTVLKCAGQMLDPLPNRLRSSRPRTATPWKMRAGMNIPNDIVDWFRDIFAASNRRLSERIQNVPAIPEPHLDTTFIEHLMAYAAPRMFPSGWSIRIDTHYLGGLRHYGNWEVADIGIFVFFQRGGSLIRQKVALLQSKRLYPTAGDIDHLEEYDVRIGMARLAQRDKYAPSMVSQRFFEFRETSQYRALSVQDNQYIAISKYMDKFHFPVFYLFYNPPKIPLQLQVPIKEYIKITENPPLGARIFPYSTVANTLQSQEKGLQTKHCRHNSRKKCKQLRLALGILYG